MGFGEDKTKLHTCNLEIKSQYGYEHGLLMRFGVENAKSVL
jgi:hypothetical protein